MGGKYSVATTYTKEKTSTASGVDESAKRSSDLQHEDLRHSDSASSKKQLHFYSKWKPWRKDRLKMLQRETSADLMTQDLIQETQVQKPAARAPKQVPLAEASKFQKATHPFPDQQEMLEREEDTIDRSKNYRELVIGSLILHLITDDKVENFKLSSNNKEFEFFNHIVLELERPKHIKRKLAIHIEYKNCISSSRHVKITSSLEKHKKSENLDTEMIFFTNDRALVFEDEEKSTFEFGPIPFDSLFFTITKGYCSCTSANVDLYLTPNIETLEERMIDTFTKMFCCDSTTSTKYLRFISKWNNIEGVKYKIDKTFATRAIVSLVVSPYIEPLSFVRNNRKNEELLKLLADTISSFNITVFRKELADEVKQIWGYIEFEENELQKVTRRYQILSEFEDVSKLNNEERSILFWLLGKCPLILNENQTTCEAMKLCPTERFILLTDGNFSQGKLKSNSIFYNLSNLEPNHEIMTAVTCSIQGKKRTVLVNLLKKTNFTHLITTNEIIQMLDGSLIVGQEEEKSTSLYMSRLILSDTDNIQESELPKYEKTLNIISARSGMGKSELVKHLKTYQNPDVWTIIIDLKKHSKYFKSHNDTEDFMRYITKDYKTIEEKFFTIFKNDQRVSFIWDAFNEISKGALHNVVKIIAEIQKKGFTQWITCRDNLQTFFEEEFRVLSKRIHPLAPDQVEAYIASRLKVSVEEANIYTTFRASILDDEFFGNPGQIFMLTECLLHNFKYSEDTVPLLDLFRQFIDYKFERYYEKFNQNNANDILKSMFEGFKKDRLKDYERIAVNELGVMNVKCAEFFKEIEENGDECDILEIDRDQNPVFIHHSFQEYFVARYLKQNWQTISDLEKILDDHTNVKTFYDLMANESLFCSSC